MTSTQGGCAPGEPMLTPEEEQAEYERYVASMAAQRLQKNLEKRRKRGLTTNSNQTPTNTPEIKE